MTDRTKGQDGINSLITKEGVPGSVTPTNLSTDQLQVMLDGSAMRDEAMLTSWANPLDDYTILATDNSVDGSIDSGIAEDAIFTLLPLASYPATWSCDIYNSSVIGYTTTIKDDGGSTLLEIDSSEAVNVRKNIAGDAFLFVQIKGGIEQVENVNAQSFVNQQPTNTDELYQFNFGAAQNLGGDIELQASGTLQFNSCKVSTQAITAQYGRVGASGTSHLFLYATVNPTGSADPAADFPIGKNFYAELNNSDITIPLFAQNNWLVIPNNGFQIKYWLVRDSSGGNSGGLFFHATSFNHNGNTVPNSSSAGLTAIKIR